MPKKGFLEGAEHYAVYRDGERIAIADTNQYSDSDAEEGGAPLAPEVIFQITEERDFLFSWEPPAVAPGPTYSYTVRVFEDDLTGPASLPSEGFRAGDADLRYEVEVNGERSWTHETQHSTPAPLVTLTDLHLSAEPQVVDSNLVRVHLGPGCEGDDYAGLFSGGSGRHEDPWRICTAHDLTQIEGLEQHYYIQLQDIDLSDNDGFPPIASIDVGIGFVGSYDGNFHRISNLDIDGDIWISPPLGLFSHIGESGVVRNLFVEDAFVTGGSTIGIIAGSSEGTIENVFASGQIQASGEWIGGLVGVASGEQSTIYGSSAQTIVSGRTYVGGLLGGCIGCVVSDSYAVGTVSVASATGVAAGFIGHMERGASVSTSYTATPIYSLASGGNATASIFAFAPVDATGGFTLVYNSYWDSDLFTGNDDGGEATGLQTSEFGDLNNFEDWNSSVWSIGELDGEQRPRHWWEALFLLP